MKLSAPLFVTTVLAFAGASAQSVDTGPRIERSVFATSINPTSASNLALSKADVYGDVCRFASGAFTAGNVETTLTYQSVGHSQLAMYRAEVNTVCENFNADAYNAAIKASKPAAPIKPGNHGNL